MNPDATQVLIGQFTRFAIDSDLNDKDWEAAAREFGVHSVAADIERFYQSWYWGDDDRLGNTNEFLRKLFEQDEDIAWGVMRRVYAMAEPDSSDLEKYPALEVLKNEGKEPVGVAALQIPSHTERFIDIDNIPGTFYPDLVEDINRSYSIGLYDATLVLTRKLLENLIIDILRKQYGKQKIELYYRTNNKRFENFGTLLDNFEDNLHDFEYLSDGLDGKFIDQLDSFRQDANSGAHSIEINITESDMQEYRDLAKHASQVLFRVFQNLS